MAAVDNNFFITTCAATTPALSYCSNDRGGMKCMSSFAAHFISLLFVDIIRAHSLEAGQPPEFYSEL